MACVCHILVHKYLTIWGMGNLFPFLMNSHHSLFLSGRLRALFLFYKWVVNFLPILKTRWHFVLWLALYKQKLTLSFCEIPALNPSQDWLRFVFLNIFRHLRARNLQILFVSWGCHYVTLAIRFYLLSDFLIVTCGLMQ